MNVAVVNSAGERVRRLARLLIVMAGILAGQFILYGPSLTGSKILTPADCLEMPRTYLPNTAETPSGYPHDPILQDLIQQFEPDRLFAVREFKAGRIPMWTPHQYGGVPFIGPKYSPFFLATCLSDGPWMVAWAQVLAALVAGLGMYFFCRRVLDVSFWPAALVAWAYPMTGFFIFWQGNWGPAGAYWLGWLLWAVDRTVRGGRFGMVGLASVSGLVLVSGHIDVAGLVLLVSGCYGLWRVWDLNRRRALGGAGRRALMGLALGWGLGLMLGAPNILPVAEYARTGYRMLQRFHGAQERPPVGMAALPQVVLPDVYGSSMRGSYPLFIQVKESNLPESAAGGYAGLLAALLAAPLSWCNRRNRSMNVFLLALAVLGISWCVNLRGITDVLSLPGLNMLSYNRLAFATAFAILAMSAMGLEELVSGRVQWRWWFWGAAAVLGLLGAFCAHASVLLPEPLRTEVGRRVEQGQAMFWVTDLNELKQAKEWFVIHYRVSAVLCGAGLLLWLALRWRLAAQRVVAGVLAVLMLGELLWFSFGRSSQCDPRLYFPEVPALKAIAESVPGRVIGFDCLPPNFAQAIGLWDVRGYDAVDPSRWVDLLKIGADTGSLALEYAVTQWMRPQGTIQPPDTIRLSPVMDMLGVRYVILRGKAPAELKPAFESEDYWVMENRRALPRLYVPRHVQCVADDADRLWDLAQPGFDARAVAYVEQVVDVPAECRGTARIVEEVPTRITAEASMETPGLVVLADLWNTGWRATVNGKRAPILRTNHALRGVAVPAGPSRIEFRYEPLSVRLSLVLAAGSGIILAAWAARGWLAGRQSAL
jgi:hypothetical protein